MRFSGTEPNTSGLQNRDGFDGRWRDSVREIMLVQERPHFRVESLELDICRLKKYLWSRDRFEADHHAGQMTLLVERMALDAKHDRLTRNMVVREGLFALRAHPFGAALRAFKWPKTAICRTPFLSVEGSPHHRMALDAKHDRLTRNMVVREGLEPSTPAL